MAFNTINGGGAPEETDINRLPFENVKGPSGCMKVLAWALVVSAIAAYFGIPWEMERRDVKRMRDDLRNMGASKWVDSSNARAHYEWQFVGSAARYFKFRIPRSDVDAFLNALEADWRDGSNTVHRSTSCALPDGSGAPGWWQPENVQDGQSLELRTGADLNKQGTEWQITASRASGDVYMYRRGY
jgi:hypothetical protein